MITTQWFSGDQDLTDAFFIRRKVFVEEQGIAEEDDFDGSDRDAMLVVVYDGARPVATGRVLHQDGTFLLGRIAVLKEERGKQYGDLVVRMLIRRAYDAGGQTQYVHSQTSARGFYEKLGFVPYGGEYLEAGVRHINMRHEGDVAGCC